MLFNRQRSEKELQKKKKRRAKAKVKRNRQAGMSIGEKKEEAKESRAPSALTNQ